MSSSNQFARLPSTVRPVNYDLELEPNLNDFTFVGRVTVDVNVKTLKLTSKTGVKNSISICSKQKILGCQPSGYGAIKQCRANVRPSCF